MAESRGTHCRLRMLRSSSILKLDVQASTRLSDPTCGVEAIRVAGEWVHMKKREGSSLIAIARPKACSLLNMDLPNRIVSVLTLIGNPSDEYLVAETLRARAVGEIPDDDSASVGMAVAVGKVGGLPRVERSIIWGEVIGDARWMIERVGAV